MRFALWAYNGGPGWVARDKALTAKLGGNPALANDVQPNNAGRAPDFFAENRGYDLAIIGKWEALYRDWGGIAVCAKQSLSNRKEM